MRTGSLAGGTAGSLDAKVTLRRLADRAKVFANHEFTAVVADVDHANRIVGTVVEARLATDAGDRVDDHLSGERFAVDGAGRAADHANRIGTVHASVGDHQPATGGTVPKETRV